MLVDACRLKIGDTAAYKAALPAVLFADGEGREAVSEQGMIGWQFEKVLRLVNQFS